MQYIPSYWERETVFKNTDVVIAGAGIVGLSAAYYLKNRFPSLSVMVVDRGFLPYGASTRNAGFCCFGSMTELLDDLENEPPGVVFKRVEKRYRGLLKLRSLIGDENMDYEPLGGFEIFTPADANEFENCKCRMDEFNKMLSGITGDQATYDDVTENIKEFGFSGVTHMIRNRHEGQLNSGKMMDVLTEKTRQQGVRIINGLCIHALINGENKVTLECDNGFTFDSRRVLVSNNGFAKTLLPGIAVTPARAQVLVTKPLNGNKIRGSFHYEKGYYYFRNIGDRLLFGGGRNLDFDGETTTTMTTTSFIQNRLDELLKNVILPGVDYEVDLRWSGIMGLGPSKTTIIRQIESNIYCAVRMGGMGVAIGCLVGEESADMVGESL